MGNFTNKSVTPKELGKKEHAWRQRWARKLPESLDRLRESPTLETLWRAPELLDGKDELAAQGLANLLAQTPVEECALELRGAWYDRLFDLSGRPGWSVEAPGIAFPCEACGAPAYLHARRHKAARPVDWGSMGRLVTATGELRSDYPRGHRYTLAVDAARVLRYVMVCTRCARGAISRCAHDMERGGEWVRCDALATGSAYYCRPHQADGPTYSRRRDLARQAPDLVPLPWT